MADEDTTNDETTGDETASEQPNEQPLAEEPAAEEPATEGDATEAGQKPPAVADDQAAAGESEETSTPRQRRKRARSTFEGPAHEPRSPAERAAERARVRSGKAATRRRWREKSRQPKQDGAAAPAPREPSRREPGTRKTRQGVVVSNKASKTITVRIENVYRHRTYGKVMHESSTLHAHDERNEAGEGDVVRVVECRPLSRTKRWRLVEILERAK